MKLYVWKTKPPQYYQQRYRRSIGWAPMMAKFIGKRCRILNQWGHKCQCAFARPGATPITLILDDRDLEEVSRGK